MDKYKNINNNSTVNRNISSNPSKNVKKSKIHEHYLMRGNNNNASFISNKNNGSVQSINDLNSYNNGSIDYDDNIDMYNKKLNSDMKSESIKRTASVESLGFVEMELREAYNNPELINELNLNIVIPNLTLAVLQAAISTTNGLTNLYHNATNPNNKNSTNKFFNNKCQCTVPDPADLPIINHGNGVMDINNPNNRENCEEQPFYNEVDELINDLPDSLEMYKDINITEEEFGFKDLKKLDQYISGLAKNLKVDDINDNFITTTNEILSRFSNPNLEVTKPSVKKSHKKEKTFKNVNSKDNILRLKRIYESKNIEFCKFPGYNEASVTPIPNNISVSDIIDNYLKTFKPKYHKRWRIYLFYKENLDMVCDIFWLTFITWYKNFFVNEFNNIFTRLSYNYVKFIGKLNDCDKNEFLVNYPLMLSHINYMIYCECFPNSKSYFEQEEFKKKDCDLIYTWFVGRKPFEEVWINWKSVHSKYLLSSNDPSEKLKKKKTGILKKEEIKENDYDIDYQIDNELGKSISNDIDSVFKKSKSKSSSLNQTSSLYTMDLKTQRIQKNINDNSPIISHYIKNIGFDSSKLPYFVQSYEISRVPKDPNKESYQQVIEESMKRTNKNLRNYLKCKEDIIKEKNRGNQETIFYMRKFNKMTQRLLTKPQQVKELCDILCKGLYSNKLSKGNFKDNKRHLPKINSDGKNNNISSNNSIDETFFK